MQNLIVFIVKKKKSRFNENKKHKLIYINIEIYLSYLTKNNKENILGY